MKQTKEEKAKIRKAIYEYLGNFTDIHNNYEKCRAYRVPDGKIFVFEGERLSMEFRPDGRRFWDDQMQLWTETEKDEAVSVSCLECPAFAWCQLIDMAVEHYKTFHGNPQTADEVKKR